MADDSATTYPEDWTYGNIYVKEPNKSIALEKEYMYVSDDKIEAVFCFRNTAALFFETAFSGFFE